jgi:hypothetical protein
VLGSTAAKLNRRKTFGEAPGLVLNWLYVHIMTRLRHMCKTSCKLTAASVRQLATLYSYCTRTGTGTRVRTVVRVRYSGRPCVCACAAAAAGWLLLHVHCSCHCSTDATMPLGTVSKMYFNPPSRRVYNSKLQVNRPKSLSCIISSLAADLRDSSYRAAEQLSSPAAEQAAAGKVRACRSGASPHLAGYLGQVDVLT